MLEGNTGVFVLDDGARVDPTTPRSALAVHPVFALGHWTASWHAAGSRWSRFELRGCAAGGERWSLSLTFCEEELRELGLSLDDSSGSEGWETWSLAAEHTKVAVHDAIAERWLGPRPWRFPWGAVVSTFDERGGTAVFAVRYERDGRPSS